jgi:hypothetical protein
MMSSAPPLSSAPPGGAVEWTTRDPQLDAWVLEHLDPAQLSILSQYDLPTRTRTVTVVQQKHRLGLVRVPAPYLLKILMSDGRGPYGASSAGAAMQGPPMGHGWTSCAGAAQGSPTPRFVATPQQQQRAQMQPASAAAGMPPWVRAAWAVHHQRSELIRHLSRTLPPKSLEAIGSLTSVQQYAACVTLLLNEQAYSDPAAFFRDWERRVRALPTVAAPSASSMPSAPQTSKVAFVHLGLSSGLEWMGALVALEKLVDSGVKAILGDRVACPMQGSCPGQLLEHLQSSDKSGRKPIHYLTPEELLPQIEKYVEEWYMAQVPVIVCIVLPPASPTPSDAMSSSGSVSSSLADFMLYTQAAKVIAARIQRCTLCVLTPAFMPACTDAWLSQALGSAITLNMQEVRIPQSAWQARLTPQATRAARLWRAIDAAACIDVLAPALQNAWDASAVYQAELPSLRTLESYLDAVEDNVEIPVDLAEQVKLAYRRNGGSANCSGTLLGRTDLLTAFAIEHLPWAEFFDAVLPCDQWINKCTGLPSSEGAFEAVACGAGRYCTACGSYYQALVEMPSFYALQEAWALSLGTQFSSADGASRSADLARLLEHDCRVAFRL